MKLVQRWLTLRISFLILASLLFVSCGASTRAASHSSTSITSTTTTSSPLVPTLGQLTGLFATSGSGWGQVEPKGVSNGGDPTGSVGSITWNSWGGSQAVGSGVSDYVASDQSVAEGMQEPVEIIAFDLGTCQGKYMYQAVEWFFPQHGESFDPNNFEDVCIGAYYPLTAGDYHNNLPGQGSEYYVIDLSGQGSSISGSLQYLQADGSTQSVFNFTGSIQLDGAMSIESTGPADQGETIEGTWATGLQVTFDNCASFLTEQSSPPCTFNF